jgi:hypothetical protein
VADSSTRSYRRIAVEEAFSVPEVFAALQQWAAEAGPDEPDQIMDDCGVVINSHTRNEYLDDEKFWPIFEAAADLGAPIYIHPRSPSAQMALPYKRFGLETGIYGFQAETGLHGIRLICSGVFDRFPNLQIVLGHLGEGIPFWLWRVDYMHPVRSSHSIRPKLELKPSEYFKRNFMITTSGMNWHPALRFCIEVLGADNIMWAIDYPYQVTVGAVEFMKAAPLPSSPAPRSRLAGRTSRCIAASSRAGAGEVQRCRAEASQLQYLRNALLVTDCHDVHAGHPGQLPEPRDCLRAERDARIGRALGRNAQQSAGNLIGDVHAGHGVLQVRKRSR